MIDALHAARDGARSGRRRRGSQRWLEVELALRRRARRARRGAGRGARARCARGARVDVARMQAIEAEVKHDVIAFVSSVAETRRRRGPLPAPRAHLVDVVDTAFALQLRDAATCCSRASTRSARAVRAQARCATATRR